MAHQFSSIGYVLERLQESEHFLFRLVTAPHAEFEFELNAFLSATRSVTFVFQKCLSHVPDFDAWYHARREEMKRDSAMRFFIELRNISQKHGPVSILAGGKLNGSCSYRFVGVNIPVPPGLKGREIVDCCAEHLQKLAALILNYYGEFPFHSCVANALTPKGMTALGYTYRDVEAYFGCPDGWTGSVEENFSADEILRLWRREVTPIDPTQLERLSAGQFQHNGEQFSIPNRAGGDLLDDVARLIDLDPDAALNPRTLFLTAFAKRINGKESEDRDM